MPEALDSRRHLCYDKDEACGRCRTGLWDCEKELIFMLASKAMRSVGRTLVVIGLTKLSAWAIRKIVTKI